MLKNAQMKKTKYKRNYKKINKNKFEQDLEHINWLEALKVNDKNVANFLQIINYLLEKHALFKQITKKEIKTRRKPWIITGILTSVQNKNKIYHKFFKAKDQYRKDLLHQQFKNYRNILSNLTKMSKENESAKWCAHVPYVLCVPYVPTRPACHACPRPIVYFTEWKIKKIETLYPYSFKGTEFNFGP